jgi:hypothetical protein
MVGCSRVEAISTPQPPSRSAGNGALVDCAVFPEIKPLTLCTFSRSSTEVVLRAFATTRCPLYVALYTSASLPFEKGRDSRLSNPSVSINEAGKTPDAPHSLWRHFKHVFPERVLIPIRSSVWNEASENNPIQYGLASAHFVKLVREILGLILRHIHHLGHPCLTCQHERRNIYHPSLRRLLQRIGNDID